MIRVGLTGGIASGKSTVAGFFAKRGAKVIDADQVAREVVLPDRPCWRKLRQLLGPEFFLPDGTLHRPRLRELIFADENVRTQVNSIVHPEVARIIKQRAAKVAEPGAVLLVDVPLLLEVNAADRFERIIVVFVPEAVQVARLMERDQVSRQEAQRILQVQMNLAEKVAMADWVIDNSGTFAQTEGQVDRLWPELLALAQAKSSKEH
ncbi:MAG: dephospho-CoA kinase [Deltaproteobacteria bacterium]|nr:dephospho-CoA kinase [Deltaproteobacteria bacterium]